MTPTDEPDLPRPGRELQAQRLAFALRSLAAELVDERRKVAQLRRDIAGLRARLDREADGAAGTDAAAALCRHIDGETPDSAAAA